MSVVYRGCIAFSKLCPAKEEFLQRKAIVYIPLQPIRMLIRMQSLRRVPMNTQALLSKKAM
jgi:hypothetical protein